MCVVCWHVTSVCVCCVLVCGEGACVYVACRHVTSVRVCVFHVDM